MRPYCASKSETKWTWREYKPIPGEIYFTEQERYLANQCHEADVILEPSVKRSASPNKDWGFDNWQTLAHMLNERRLRVAQVGPQGTSILNAARLIVTPTFRVAAAYLSRVKAAVLPEGGLHHAAAAVGIRAVVIFGGYISDRQTGYDLHTNLFTGGEPCGMRTRCQHCADAMAKIKPEEVAKAVLKIIGQ
jgi:ADP-heptose:LPS heptosyltransferase